mmetsp:Transcript_27589/g.92274  ORF Transcript_27589/g.92274 Transcript_27589/m.92274 type:complete len:203 (+) Transcript_27589:438-1046(+)
MASPSLTSPPGTRAPRTNGEGAGRDNPRRAITNWTSTAPTATGTRSSCRASSLTASRPPSAWTRAATTHRPTLSACATLGRPRPLSTTSRTGTTPSRKPCSLSTPPLRRSSRPPPRSRAAPTSCTLMETAMGRYAMQTCVILAWTRACNVLPGTSTRNTRRRLRKGGFHSTVVLTLLRRPPLRQPPALRHATREEGRRYTRP